MISFRAFFMQQQDCVFMDQAIQLAKKGKGKVNPNPLVGAVLVRDNQIIGTGYHKIFGGPHAEVNAFQSANGQQLAGSTLYVTLEPCSHYGKTPPCADLIVKHQIARVVIGLRDPNPLVAGRGIEILKQAGIEVEVGCRQDEISYLNRVFIKYIQSKIPYLMVKTAMTLDGKIASSTGDSKWISSYESRQKVHQFRNEFQAIMVGIQTVLNDDPMLSTRIDQANGRNPIRIVADSTARIPLSSNLVNTASVIPLILVVTGQAPDEKIEKLKARGLDVIVTPAINKQIDLVYLMRELGERGIDSVLLEGGSTLNYSALKAGIVDEVISFIAPKIVGGENAKTPFGGIGIEKMQQAVVLEQMKFENVGPDLMISGLIK